MSTGAHCPAPPSFRPRLWKWRVASGATAAFAVAAFWAAPPSLAAAQSAGDASAAARQGGGEPGTQPEEVAIRSVGR